MKNASTVFLVVMMFCSLGLWGCTHQKNGAYHSRIRDLENRYVKLEEDYKAIVHVGESLRKKVNQLENQRNDLNQQVVELRTVAQERDDLRGQLANRTQERDTLHTQLSQFRKDMQDLLGRVDTALAETNGNSVTIVPASRTKE